MGGRHSVENSIPREQGRTSIKRKGSSSIRGGKRGRMNTGETIFDFRPKTKTGRGVRISPIGREGRSTGKGELESGKNTARETPLIQEQVAERARQRPGLERRHKQKAGHGARHGDLACAKALMRRGKKWGSNQRKLKDKGLRTAPGKLHVLKPRGKIPTIGRSNILGSRKESKGQQEGKNGAGERDTLGPCYLLEYTYGFFRSGGCNSEGTLGAARTVEICPH